MPKFYVQCGPRSLIVTAFDQEAAAMQLVDLAMQPHLWIYDDQGLSDQDRRDHLVLEALLHLAPEIRVSEQGFHRPDAVSMGTPETIQTWHATMVSLSKLFIAAGLCAISMRQLT